MIDPKNLTDFIKKQGWSSYGIVSANAVKEALKQNETVFERWIGNGYQADMDYLENMQRDRFHPENKLPDIKSVIVLTAWYGQEEGDEGALVARYARGRDYHKVLKKKMSELSDWLKAQNEAVETYLSVDSGPTVDRVLAQLAGLGFFGKNANIIDPRKGSYFFIASIMVNQEITVTKPDRMPSCGDCRRCITACPTGAIVAPGVIDARRCISYLTIENKGGIPEELRTSVGNRLFGCDICQEVCPFNESRGIKQQITIDDISSGKGVGARLDLAEILAIDNDEQFLKKFAGTPLMRAKRRGIVRNACIVAGNTGDIALVAPLRRIVEQENDEMLKEHANWAIGQIEGRAIHKISKT